MNPIDWYGQAVDTAIEWLQGRTVFEWVVLVLLVAIVLMLAEIMEQRDDKDLL